LRLCWNTFVGIFVIDNEETVEVKPSGRFVVVLLVLAAAACSQAQRSLPAPTLVPVQRRDERVLTPEQVFQHKQDLIGQSITVRGTAQPLWSHCTEIVCPEQDPCCNACWCGVGFWADGSEGQDIALSSPDIDCSGNECLITCQPFEFGVTYVVTGSLREDGGSNGLKASASALYLDVVDFRISLLPAVQVPIDEQDQNIIIVSIPKSAYGPAADRLAEVEAMHMLHSGAGLIWYELGPDGLEELAATGIEFERWYRIIVSLSTKAYRHVADIEHLHKTEYSGVVWLELTPSNLEKLRASGVEFEIRNAAMLRFREYHFDPLVSEPSLPVKLTANYKAGVPALYLVQLYGPPKDEWLEDLEARGVESLGYFASEAHRMRMTPRQAARIERLEFIRWVGPYHPAYRVSPYLWEYAGTIESEMIESEMIENVSMMIYDDGQVGGTVDRTIREIEALGGKLIDQSRSNVDATAYATFVLPASAITSTATLNDLLWLEYSLSEMILE
jgi:hypothetical protein